MGVVDVKQTSEHELTLEWESSASNDMVADSTLALITGIDRSPASAKRKCIFSCPFHLPCSSQRSSLIQVYTEGNPLICEPVSVPEH